MGDDKLLIKSGVVGDKKIKRALGKDIFIYPFNEGNLKGASYNLTASKLAYLASDKKLIANGNNKLVIPPQETALIQTKEAIYVRKGYCGTYHSKVRLVSQGLSHIGTTLDPEYIGASLIGITNHSKLPITIDTDSTIVTLMFYKVDGCSKDEKDNPASRTDIIPEEFNGFYNDKLTNKQKQEIETEIRQQRKEEWRNDYKALITKVREVNNIKSWDSTDTMKVFIFIVLYGVVGWIYKTQALVAVAGGISITIAVMTWLDSLYKKIVKG